MIDVNSVSKCEGRNRHHQGLAASIIKLWEKSLVAKIAVKRGVQNTNNELMSEELKANFFLIWFLLCCVVQGLVYRSFFLHLQLCFLCTCFN